MKQTYYQSTFTRKKKTTNNEIVGKLNIAGTKFASQWTISTISWDSCIQILKASFAELLILNSSVKDWHIFLEYEIPRLYSRIDVVIIASEIIFVIEFKYDRNKYELEDIRQVEDYANDLYDFHLQSRNRTIVPILLAPLAKSTSKYLFREKSKVTPCLNANKYNLSEIVHEAYITFHDPSCETIDHFIWEQSEYQPTPTIVQAARALFAGQKVESITKSGADISDLKKTTTYLIDNINKARGDNIKIICFVTGVPGAGKTLVGLNIVHEKEAFSGKEFDQAYFSGNGPLIKVLREALSRDDFSRSSKLYKKKQITGKPSKSESERRVKAKIQNLHTFIKDCIRKDTPPIERIVVFDEAQRCWDANHFFNQSKRNQNRETNPFNIQEKSEAELLFEFMNRHDGWAVIIALVGGGQEINTGEAGISEWGKALRDKYFNWHVHISPQLLHGNAVTLGRTLFESIPQNVIIEQYDDLHLNVSMRSFRAENLNEWVNALLDNNSKVANDLSKIIGTNYPLLVTRKLEKAKNWLKENLSGNKRIGLLASSGGIRLRPFGINVKEEINEAYWFLNDASDIRSSSFLEITATEFAVQGLELDWVGLCWDADLRRNKEKWEFKNFRGTKWTNLSTTYDRQYLLNKYRVLLTRAREGLIIFVPEGEPEDISRQPEIYNEIFEYLINC